MNTDMTEIFGAPIYTYTRRQAVEDGAQIDVTETAREAGFRVRVFVTRAVWDAYVEVPDGVTDHDERGRLWDILSVARFTVKCAAAGEDTLSFNLHVRMIGGMRVVKLWVQIGATDFDDQRQAITIMTDHDL